MMLATDSNQALSMSYSESTSPNTSLDIYKYSNNISLVTDYGKRSGYYTYRMMELYGSCEDTLKQIVENRSQYDNITDPAFDLYKDILKTYDYAFKMRPVDEHLYSALISSALFKVYQITSDDSPDIFLDDTEDDKGKIVSRISHKKISDYLIRKYCIISHNNIPYLYIGNQYFQDDKRERLEKDIVKIFESLGFTDSKTIKTLEQDVIKRIIAKTHKLREFPLNKLAGSIIPVRNGVIYRKTIELLPHSPAFLMLYHLDINFNISADKKFINEYLNSLVEFPEQDADLLLQIPAQALLQRSGYQLAYLVTGDGQNGKSLFLQLLCRLIGKENYTAVSLQDLSNNKFAPAELQGRLMNIFPDLSKDAVKYLGILKALTGDDVINVERKYGHQFKLENKAVLIFSANELPIVQDSTWAFWRRWCVIPFPHTFKKDPDFPSKLLTDDNLSAFLLLVIDKMNRLEKYGLVNSHRVDQAMSLWKERSNSVYAFIKERIQRDIKEWIKKDTLYDLYLAFCEEKDITSQDIKMLTKELAKIGISIDRVTIDQGRAYVYKSCKVIQAEEKREVQEVF